MNNPLKILSVTVMAVAAVYAGVKGYLYFNIKSELDNAIAMAGPFVHIEYGGIGSGFDGRISIEDIDIFPPGIEEPLRIESLSVRWPHMGYLFSGFQAAPGEALPERMTLALNGVHLPTSGGLANSLQQNLRRAEASAAPKLPDPCSLQGTLQGEDYASMGYEALVVDASLSYELDQAAQELRAQFDLHLRKMQTLSMDMRVTGVSQPAAMMMGVVPKLKAFDASYQAYPEYLAKVIRYCAERREQTDGEYIRALASERGGGFEPGAGMRRAIEAYLQNPGEILVSMRPAEPLDVSTLVHYKPEDVVTLLGLRVQVGGKELKDMSFDLSVPKGLGGAKPGRSMTPGATAPADPAPIRRSAVSREPVAARPAPVVSDANTRLSRAPQRRYLPTEARDLERYLGRKVRLFTHDKTQPRSGVLVSIKDGQAHLEQRVFSGTMTTHVPMVEIKTAEVFRAPVR